MAEDAGTKVPILLLTKDNWLDWIDYYEDVLTGKGLWSCTKNEPSDHDEKGVQRDAIAVSILKAAAGVEGRQHTRGLRTSKAVLDKLKEIHTPAQEERTSMLLAQFHGFKFCKSVDLTASRLTQLQTDIGSAKLSERPSDDSKKACLIRCLPEKFQSTVFALKAAGVSKMSYEDVVQRLRDIESEMEEPEYDSFDTARVVRTKNHRRGQSSHADKKCYHCGRPGHLKSNCWRRIKEEEEEQSYGTNEMATATMAW